LLVLIYQARQNKQKHLPRMQNGFHADSGFMFFKKLQHPASLIRSQLQRENNIFSHSQILHLLAPTDGLNFCPYGHGNTSFR
jgi:hypothetical protein